MIIQNTIKAFIDDSRKIIVIVFILFGSLSTLTGQNRKPEPPPLRERIFFGGNFGLQFGTITNINVAPIVGFMVLPRVSVALGPKYVYYKDPYGNTNIYGGTGYVQFAVIQDIGKIIQLGSHTGIFLHLEDELLSLESEFWKYPPIYSPRFTVNTVLGGVGIRQMLGMRASINIMFLWALNESAYYTYGNPDIRVSFNF